MSLVEANSIDRAGDVGLELHSDFYRARILLRYSRRTAGVAPQVVVRASSGWWVGWGAARYCKAITGSKITVLAIGEEAQLIGSRRQVTRYNKRTRSRSARAVCSLGT